MTVKELRTAAGMKRREFAEYFGIDYRTVQKWELDTSNPESRKCPEYLFALMKYKLEKEGILKDGTSVLTVAPYGKTPKLFKREQEVENKTKGANFKTIRDTMPPRGYDFNEDGTLRINEEEAEKVQKAFHDFLETNKE